MSLTRKFFALAIPCGFAAAAPRLAAQGVTTAAIEGTVRMQDGTSPAGARVAARNTATGFAVEVEARKGHFLLQGLEPGGPYVVSVRRIGARPLQRVVGFLALGEPLILDLTLEPAPALLDTLV